jgi:hypothetical protein
VRRSRSNRRAVLALLAVLGVGCSGQPDLATAGTTEFGRSTTPAPDAVNAPRAVHVAIEVRTETEPEVAEASVEIDPDELRASWEADRLADAGGTIDADHLTGQLVHHYRAVVISWDEPEYADEAREASVVLSDPVELDLPELDE